MWFDSGPFDRLRAGSSTDSGPADHERWIRVRGLGLVGGRGDTGALGLLGAAGSRLGDAGMTGEVRSGCVRGRGGRFALELIEALGPGRGRRDDGGTEGAGRGLGAAGCVQSVGPMCSVLGGNVSSFWPNVFTFWRNVFTLAGQVFSFRWRALVGDRGRREGEIRSFGKLRTGFGRLRAGSSGTPG